MSELMPPICVICHISFKLPLHFLTNFTVLEMAVSAIAGTTEIKVREPIRMNKLRNAVGLAGIVLVSFASGAHASTVLADWTFETSAPVTSGPITPEVGSGSAIGSHASGAAVYTSPAGNGSTHSFSSSNWATGDYYQFSVDTQNYSGISLTWDQTSSNTGPKDFQLQYSINGTTFTSFASYSVLANATPNTPWTSTGGQNAAYTLTEDLSSVTALNDQSTVFLRLVQSDAVSANGGAIGTSGTDRVDNVIIAGTAVAPVPLPATAWLLGSGLLGSLGIRRRRRAA